MTKKTRVLTLRPSLLEKMVFHRLPEKIASKDFDVEDCVTEKQKDTALQEENEKSWDTGGGADAEQDLAKQSPTGGADLAAALEAAKTEAKDSYDRLLRMAAEFENYKKRMERERQNALKFAEENIIRELLPSIDNLDRALEQAQGSGDVATVLEGVAMTRDGLLASLSKIGVASIASVGAVFDPNFHEALVMEESRDIPANSIVREFQKGYMFKDRLIRAAKVVVSSGGTK